MEELLTRLKAELAKDEPSSDSLSELLKQIEATSIGQPSGFSTKTLIASVLGALGIGGVTGGGIGRLNWKDFERLPLPTVTSYWTLLAIVAVLGALVGLGHSFYRNNWTFLPLRFSRAGGGFKLESWGFVLNMVMAAAVAIATTWMATSKEAAPALGPDGKPIVSSATTTTSSAETNPAPGSESKPVVGSATTPKSLLTWQVLLSAIVASFVGSRMASGETEKNVLWKALSSTAEMPAVPGLSAQIEGAKTPHAAAAIAAGQVPQSKDTEDKLLTLLDRGVLKETIVKSGRPLTADGAGLTLAALELLQPLKSGLKSLLKDFETAKVADMPVEAFEAEAGKRGIETKNFKELLENIHKDTVTVMQLLRSLPPTWNLSAERL